jgi:RNase H-fold protein (predicted Holliday junction resolvase)
MDLGKQFEAHGASAKDISAFKKNVEAHVRLSKKTTGESSHTKEARKEVKEIERHQKHEASEKRSKSS